ncbi:MAG: hypothetical protein HOE35_03400 [Candidatus Ruthia sp.]|nr:hypothetical protein [Candidatus Ruthturnera sp.]
MIVNSDDLQKKYSVMTTEDLVDLGMRGGLTDTAMLVLTEILVERNADQGVIEKINALYLDDTEQDSSENAKGNLLVLYIVKHWRGGIRSRERYGLIYSL